MDLRNHLSVQQISEQIPPARNGKKTHFSTVFRWITAGMRNRATGRTVKLSAVRVGGRWMVSKDALEQFFEACNPITQDEPATLPIRTPTARQRANERAKRELQKAGI